MHRATILIAIAVLAAVGFAQSGGDLYGPIVVRDGGPEFPSTLLSQFYGDAKIDLFVEVASDGRIKNIEAFGPWLTCVKDDPIADQLRIASIEAAKRIVFVPARRGEVNVDGALVISYSSKGSLPATSEPEPWLKSGAHPTPVGGVVNGRAISIPKPIYPPMARKYRLQGQTIIDILLDEQGIPINARARSGHPLLLTTSAKAACDARFTPTLLSGYPVKVSGSINFYFIP